MAAQVVVAADPGLCMRDEELRLVRALVRRAVCHTLRARAVATAEISVTLCGDNRMRALNREWLDRDRPTDVLAFPLWQPGESPIGDVYVGVDRAVAQAMERELPPEQELMRLAVHGTLHALGHDHPEGRGRTASPMWRLQERLVAELEAS